MYVGELANRTCKRHQIDLSPRTYYGRKIPTHFSLHDCLKSLQSWTRFANITTCPIRPLGRFGCGVGTMSRGEMKYTCDWKQTIELFIRFCHCLLPFVIMVVNGKLRYTRRSMKQPSSYRNVVWVP